MRKMHASLKHHAFPYLHHRNPTTGKNTRPSKGDNVITPSASDILAEGKYAEAELKSRT